MHNELIYEPNTFDRDRWERSMFQVCNPPPKLSSWQDYFLRIKQGEDLFPEFLHHYEPVLNSIAQKHISRYGLDDHFADVKMVYVETLLAELEHYDPASDVSYLTSIIGAVLPAVCGADSELPQGAVPADDCRGGFA